MTYKTTIGAIILGLSTIITPSFAWSQKSDLVKEFDKAFGFDPFSYSALPSRYLGVELINEAKQIVLYVYVPGIDPKDLELSIENNYLTIRGKSVISHSKDSQNSRIFHRYVELPVAVNGDKATAKLKHGILTITLPKLNESQAKKITIQE